MTNINGKIVIKCKILSGCVHDSRMGLTVIANSDIIHESDQLCDDFLDLEFTVDLPSTIQFQVHGKMPGDTEIDSDGNVVRDKCVILDALCINGMWVKKYMLENKLIAFCPNNAEPRITNYFGQDGTANFVIPYDNLLEFWLDLMTVDQ